MPILTTGNTFATGDNPTAHTLNNAVNNATFASGAVDNSTTQLSGGAIIVKDAGITTAKLSTGGPTWTSGGALTASGGLQNTAVGSTTPSTGAFTTLSASGSTSLYEVIEKATVSASAPSSTTNFNVLDGAVVYYTSNTANNWTLNIRASSGATLNSTLATGDSVTFAVIVTNGSTAYYPSAHTIDGSSVTVKWAGGTAPSAGNASSLDAYVYTVIKTASATYIVLGSATRFA